MGDLDEEGNFYIYRPMLHLMGYRMGYTPVSLKDYPAYHKPISKCVGQGFGTKYYNYHELCFMANKLLGTARPTRTLKEIEEDLFDKEDSVANTLQLHKSKLISNKKALDEMIVALGSLAQQTDKVA